MRPVLDDEEEEMPSVFKADAIVVGAGTSGSYFAWRLAQAGLRVLILEKRVLEELGQHIDIFHMDAVRFAEFDIPLPEGDEVEHLAETGLMWSPDLQVKQEIHYPFYVMHKPLFHRRLHRYVRDSGGQIVEGARVTDVILDGGRLVGVRGERDGEAFEARAALVVDASGIKAEVRTRLPAEFGVENDPIRDSDRLFVCLEYREGTGGGSYPTGSNFYPFHKAFWNLGPGEQVILGIGQPDSYDYAWQKHREWREEYFGDPGRVVRRCQGTVPFRRSPFSLVGDGFLAIGDAVYQNKPFSGEGVTSGFAACQIAAEVALDTLAAGRPDRAALWPYNARYFRGQGAKFAAGLAQLPATAELSRGDVDWLFHHSLIFTQRDFEALNQHYEIPMDLAATLVMGLKMVGGVLGRGFSAGSLRRLLSVSGQAGKIKQHYQQYPEEPAGFAEWARTARSLWG
jgi:digeranylgeranylglycerophospholipid reductase